MGIVRDDLDSVLTAVKEDLKLFQIYLTEAFLVWGLNNRTHNLAKDVLGQQIKNVAAGKHGMAAADLLQPLYSKAVEVKSS